MVLTSCFPCGCLLLLLVAVICDMMWWSAVVVLSLMICYLLSDWYLEIGCTTTTLYSSSNNYFLCPNKDRVFFLIFGIRATQARFYV